MSMAELDHTAIRALGCDCAAHCIRCGCGDLHACLGGCAWVEDPLDRGPLCSNCLPVVIDAIEQLELDLATLEALKLIERVDAGTGDVHWMPRLGRGGLAQ